MAIEIQVQTSEAQSNVNALDTKVVGLIGNLKDAYKAAQSLNSGFSFSSAAISEIQKVRQEFETLKTVMAELRAEVALSAGSLSQFASASSGIVQSSQNQSRAVLGVVDSIKQQSASTLTSIAASKDMAAAASKEAAALLEVKDALNQEISARSQAVAIAQRVIDAEGSLAKTQEDLNKLFQNGRISLEQYDKALAIASQSISTTATQAEKMLQSLTQQNAAFGQTQAGAARAASGYELLTQAQQKEIVAQANLNDAMKRLTPIIQEQITPLGAYRERLQDLTMAQQAHIESQGKAGITAQQFTTGMKAAHDELRAGVAASTSAATGIRGFHTEMNVANQGAAAFRATLEGSGLGFGIFTGQTILAATAAYGFATALRSTLSAGAEFQDTVVRSAVFAGNYKESIDAMGRSVTSVIGISRQLSGVFQDLSVQTKFSSQEFAEAAAKMTQAGVKTIDVYSSLKSVADIARIGNSSLVESASSLITVSHLFDLSFQDAAHTASQLAIAVTSAQTSVEQITRGLVTVGPIAREAGLGLGQVASILATLERGGFEDKAGTGIRAIIGAIGKETPVAQKALAELGVSFKQFYSKDALEFVGAMEKIRDALADKTIETKMTTLSALFRSQGAAGGSFLIQHIVSLKEFAAAEAKASDEADRLARAMNNTVKTAFDELKNSITNIEQNAFSGFENPLYDSIKAFTEYLQRNGPVISQQLSSITQSLLVFAEFVVSHGSALMKMVEAYAAYKGAIVGLSSMIGIYDALTLKIKGFETAARDAAVAQKTLAEGAIMLQEAQMFAANGMGKTATVAKEAAVGIGVFAAAETVAATASIGFTGYASAALAAIGGWPVLIAAAIAGLILFGPSLLSSAKSMEELTSQAGKAKNSLEDLRDIWVSLGKLTSQGLRQSGRSILEQLGLDQAGFKDAQDKVKQLQEQLDFLRQSPGIRGENNPMIVQAKADLEAASLAAKTFKEGIAELTQKQGEWTAATLAQSGALNGMLSPLTKNSNEATSFIEIVRNLGVNARFTELALDKLPTTLRLLATGMRAAGVDTTGFLQQLAAVVAAAQPKTSGTGTVDDGKEAVARAKELASELRSIVQAYDKQVPSTEAILHNLGEISSVTAAFLGRTKQVTEELSKMGFTADQVGAALQWKTQSTIFNEIRSSLILLNPLYKDLNFNSEDGARKAVDHATAIKQVDAIVSSITLKFPKLAAEAQAMGAQVKAGMADAEDGTKKLDEKFAKLTIDAPIAYAKLFEGKDGIAGLAEAYGRVGDKLTTASQLTLAYTVATAGLGSFIKQTYSEEDKLASMQDAVNRLLAAGGENAARLAQAMQLYKESLPTGQIEKNNQNIQNQITLMKAGVTDLTAYNELWRATKGHLENATAAMIAAAESSAKLNDTLQQIKQVQQIYKTFADSLGNVFKNVLDGTDNSFKKFFTDIKSQFEKLLLDMVTAAIKQQIMFAFGFAPQGGSPMVGAMQSGGSNIISSIGSFFGFGGQQQTQTVAPAPAQGANLNLGSLVSQAIQSNLGYDTSNATGGSFGGTNLLSLLSMGKQGFGMFSGGGSAAASAGGFNYFDSVFGTGGGTGAAAGALNLSGAPAFVGQAGGINLSASAGANAGAGAGAAAPAAGGIQFMPLIGGILAGYNEFKAAGGGAGGVAGAAAYGVGTYAIGVATSAAMTSGIAAGFAAIPVVGWIALAAMAINMISGGKLFGTSWKPTGSETTLSIGEDKGNVTSQTFESRQKAWFGGTAYKTIDNKVDSASQAQAEQMFKDIQGAALQAQQTLGVSMVGIVSGTFKTIYDKKGKLTDEFSTVLGVIYHESVEDFKKRLTGESLVAAVGASLTSMGLAAGEASNIAQQYRANASALLDAATTMVTVQKNIKDGAGLLQETGAGVLTRTMALVSKLQNPGEALADTYARLVASTALLSSVYDGLGVATGKTRSQFIEFSATVVTLLGGVQAAQTAWQQFTASMYIFAEQIIKPAANANLATAFNKIGLDPSISLADFKIQFQRALPQFTADQLADWIKAGSALGTINQAMTQMSALSKGVDISSLLNQQAAIVNTVNTLIKAARDAGASQDQLATLEAQGALAIQQQLKTFMQPIEQQLAKMNGREFTYQLDQIQQTMQRNIITATALGASDSQLADIQALAAYQTGQVIATLQSDLGAAVAKLYGSTVAVNAAATQSASTLNTVSQLQVNVYNANLARYNAELAAIKTITDFVNSSLVGTLSPLGWQGQLNTAQSQFASQLQSAKGGDPNSIASITQFAQTYLQQAQAAYGNSAQYGQIFAYVMDALKNLKTQFAGSTAGGAPANPGAVGSGGSGGGSSGPTTPVMTDAEKFQLALQISQQIGQLGLALNVSVFDLMKQYGLTTAKLASDLGVNLNNFNDATITNLKLMNSALGTKMTDLLTELKVSPAQIGAYFKITGEQLNAGNLTGLKDLAKFLGTTVFDAMKFLGTDIATVTKGLGLDIAKLDRESVDNLIKIAGILGVSSKDLMTALGITMAQLATSFGINISGFNASMVVLLNTLATKFGTNIIDLAISIGVNLATFTTALVTSINTGLQAIPNLPASFTTGIKPYLDAITNAKTPEDLKTAYANLNTYLSNLPAALVALITPLFTSLGFNIIKGDGGVTSVKASVDQGDGTLGSIDKGVRDGFTGITDPIRGLPQAIATGSSNVVDAIGKLNITSVASVSAATATKVSAYNAAAVQMTNVSSSVAQQLFDIAQRTSNAATTATNAAANDTAKALTAVSAKLDTLNATVKTVGTVQASAQVTTSTAIQAQTRQQKLSSVDSKMK